jgi:C-methyltransferase
VVQAGVPPAWVVRPLLAVRNGIARLHRAMVPPQVAVVERTLGIVDTKALAVAADLGVADALVPGPRSAANLAGPLGVEPDALERLLRFLVGRGFFRRSRDGRYRNNRASALLARDHPASLNAWARFFGAEWHVAIWNRLGHSVATGGSAAESALGHDFWRHLTAVDPEAGRVFDDAMESVSRLQQSLVATKYEWPTRATVCDVGGGTGTLLAAILVANTTCTGVLFDLPAVVARAGPVLERAGVTDRVTVTGGDFFESVPPGCDRYVLQAIVHDWDDESCVRVLNRCRQALAPGGRVLVVEQTLPEHDGDHPAKALDLEMLVDTGKGRERTRADFDALFAAAGFGVRRVVPIAIVGVYELEPAP